MSYLMWQNWSKTMPVDQKVNEAVHAHLDKFGAFPAEVLVNPADHAAFGADETTGGIRVVPRRQVARDSFWVGRPDPVADLVPR